MESIVENQRRIIEDVTGKPAKETPQVWALYKRYLIIMIRECGFLKM